MREQTFSFCFSCDLSAFNAGVCPEYIECKNYISIIPTSFCGKAKLKKLSFLAVTH